MMKKTSVKEIPFTLDLLKNGGVKKGDLLVPYDSLYSSIKNRTAFLSQKYYKVLEVRADGVVLNSEIGKYFVHFNSPDGGADNFYLVEELSNEELLGTYGTLPLEIMQLFQSHKKGRRNEVAQELAYKYGIDNKSKKDALFKDVVRIFEILEDEGLIEPIRIGVYALTDKGQLYMR
ncbi:MAG: hypothetical protein M0R03_14435 [Novosphingobium sp.]|nr:hypothetical protein [Novosphingobium sp.]